MGGIADVLLDGHATFAAASAAPAPDRTVQHLVFQQDIGNTKVSELLN